MEMIKKILLSGLIIFFTACSFHFTSESENVESLVNNGIKLMKQKKWNDALELFAWALMSDPNNEKAIIGYSITNLACAGTDPKITLLMKNILGFKNYPDEPCQIFSFSSWNQIVNQEISEYYTNTIPQTQLISKIVNQDIIRKFHINWSSDSIDDLINRSIIFSINCRFYNFQHENSISDTSMSFENQLNQIIRILHMAKDTSSFTLCDEMYSERDPVEFEILLPPGTKKNINEIIIGKAEVLLIASILKSYCSILYLAQAYNHSFPLDKYQKIYAKAKNPLNPDSYGIIFNSLTTYTPEAINTYAKANNCFSSSLSWSIEAINQILKNRQGFSISADPCVGIISLKNWKLLTQELNQQKQIFNKLNKSVNQYGLNGILNDELSE